MKWEAIKTKAEYKKAIKRTIEIFNAEDGTSEGAELDILLVLVKDYEDKYIVLPELN